MFREELDAVVEPMNQMRAEIEREKCADNGSPIHCSTGIPASNMTNPEARMTNR
jgi:hypothetical protein